MKALDAFRVPLQGRLLIEAAAGTGKTWSITSLYLRLVLERRLPVAQILVVTFTRAATEELGRRIRGRLAWALAWLEGRAARDDDPELADWLTGRADPGDADTLRAALAGIDRAAIFTIHGYCQRVLQELALETSAPFDAEFLEDEEAQKLRAAEDVWRLWFEGDRLSAAVQAWLLERLPTPECLLAAVGKRLNDPTLKVLPEAEDPAALLPAFEAALAERAAAHAALQALAHQQDDVAAILRESSALNRKTYNPGAVEKALAALDQLRRRGAPVTPDKKFELLTPGQLAKSTKKGQTTPTHELFDACGRYHNGHQAVEELGQQLQGALLAALRRMLEETLARAKRQARQLAFDDLLVRLHQPLTGPGGDALATTLRRRHPVALIDEFQDTDEIQWRIFDRIHPQGATESTLVLIGDPKQAIYAFRGGDLHTYLNAAGQVDQARALQTNWRSGSRLIAGVNALFQASPDPFREPRIHYRPVQPSPRADAEPLRVEGAEPVPLQFWALRPEAPEARAKKGQVLTDAAKALAAEYCARHIAWLLEPGRTTLGDEPLQPRHIALLVRGHKETLWLQEALRSQGLSCVALGRESVFETAEAEDIEALLTAVVHCEDDALVRYALAGPLLGHDAADLERLAADDQAWSEILDLFHDTRRRWQAQGFIPAFWQLFHRCELGRRLLAGEEGERRLTNLLQLAELLGEAARRRPAPESLLVWLATQRRHPPGGEATKMRLESDEGLVRIVTMHASKGLEYPVVYIPFPWSRGRRNDPPWFYHDAAGQPCLHLNGGDPEAVAAAKSAALEEETAEAQRLFYVAVTRAARLCVLPWAWTRDADQSALGWLLYGGDKPADEAAFFAPLAELAAAHPEAISLGAPPQVEAAAALEGGASSSPSARPFTGRVKGNWRITSYSALVSGSREAEAEDYDAQPAEPAGGWEDPIQRLPAGSRFGRFVHQLFQELDFTAAAPAVVEALARRLAPRFGLPPFDATALQAVVRLVEQTLQTPLPGSGLRLAELSAERRVDELEFHFACGTDLDALGRLLAGHPDWAGALDGLTPVRLEGLIHGYIDLVYEHQGRYYLADYKSNRLDDYGPAAIDAAMAGHHYPLQALLYALALHRHLGATLAGYDPARHFGGVHYLFLRGLANAGGGIWHRSCSPALLDELDRLMGGRP